jgi:16S rRNA processing protein RimM
MQQDYVEFCRVLKTRGLKGEIKVLPYNDSPSSLQDIAFLHIQLLPQQFERHDILKRNISGAAVFLFLEGINSIEQAQELVGQDLFIQQSQMRLPEEGKVYQRDLLQCEVRTVAGQRLGLVRDLMDLPQGLLLVLQLSDPDPERKSDEALIPFIPEFVQEVDLKAKIIIVDLPEGLV